LLDAQTDKKSPVPDPAARAKALESVKQQHHLAFQKAEQDLVAAKVLAGTLLKQAGQNATAPPSRFVLLQQAAELAARAGDMDLALQALDELGQAFVFDAGAVRAGVFETAGPAVKGVEPSKALVEVARNDLAEALDRDDYDLAARLGKVAEQAAMRTKDLPLVLAVRRERQGIEVSREKYAQVKPFADRLQKDPTDAEANLKLGQYLCLNKGDWEKGLYYLAQCNDPTLRRLAQHDLIQPDVPREQLELGDRWWNLAGKLQGQVKVHLKQRAVHWYERAVEGVEPAAKSRMEERIASVPPPRRSTIGWDNPGAAGQLRLLGQLNGSIYGVAYAPDGKTVLAGTVTTQVVLYNTADGKQVRNLPGHIGMIWSVAYDPKGKHAFSAAWDGTIKMWDVKTGQEVRRFPNGGRIADINGIAVSPDGKYLMAGCDDTQVHIWDIKTGTETQQLRGHMGVVYGVAFSPDGRRALSGGGGDNTMILWDLKTGKALRKFSIQGQVRNVAFTPDGRKAVGAGENTVTLWDLQTGQVVRRFQGHNGVVFALAISRDGRRLVTGGTDRSIRYWDVATGRQITVLTGHNSTIFALALSPGGGRVVTGSADNTVRLWGLPRQ
jgi:DNA-binding beta-propeller fold protein YncE